MNLEDGSEKRKGKKKENHMYVEFPGPRAQRRKPLARMATRDFVVAPKPLHQ
jgi:hypothetical protein